MSARGKTGKAMPKLQACQSGATRIEMLQAKTGSTHGQGVKRMRAAEDLWSVRCAGNSGEGWLCCVVTINARCTCYKLSSLKQTYAFSTSLRVKRLQFHHFASHSCLSPQGPGQKTRSRSILAERNSLINDECQMPMWLSISHYQMRLRWVSYRAGTNPKAVQQVCVCMWVCIFV